MQHWGPLVPPGTVGVFCPVCAGERAYSDTQGLEPLPLGHKLGAGEQ